MLENGSVISYKEMKEINHSNGLNTADVGEAGCWFHLFVLSHYLSATTHNTMRCQVWKDLSDIHLSLVHVCLHLQRTHITDTK